MKLSEASDLLRGPYTEVFMQGLANMPKTKYKKFVGCCKCGSSQITLRKINGEYWCIRCYKENENERN